MKTGRFMALLLCAAVTAVAFNGCASKVRAPADEREMDSSHTDDARSAPSAGVLYRQRAVEPTLSEDRAAIRQPAGEREIVPPLGPDEELWVIARASGAAAPSAEEPVYPSLRAKATDGGVDVPLPLQAHRRRRRHRRLHRHRRRHASSTTTRTTEKIEAVYVFPLPQNAAVNEFVMTIGERHIRGIIREREEAERIYAEAKQQGYVASLLTAGAPQHLHPVGRQHRAGQGASTSS